MKSILLVGQSNMAGRGFITDVEPIINEHIKVLKNGRWQFMEEPIHQDRAVAGIGPAASFAQLWVDEHPNETLGLIPCADGGTSIDDWAPDQILTRHAISEAQFAMETSELIGVLWHQGENDSNNDKYQNYQEKLQQFIAHMRHALDQPDLPVILGGARRLFRTIWFRPKCNTIPRNQSNYTISEQLRSTLLFRNWTRLTF